MWQKVSYIVLFWILSNSVCFAQTSKINTNVEHQVAVIANPSKTIHESLNQYLTVLEDTAGKLTYEQIISPTFQQRFTPYNQRTKEFKHQYTYWGKITLQNQAKRKDDWLLHIGGRNSVVELYIPQPEGKALVKKTGVFVPVAQKSVNEAILSLAKIYLPYQTPQTIYIKIVMFDKRTPKFNLELHDLQNYNEGLRWESLFQGMFQGVFWIMILYNLVIFFSTKDRTYLYYSSYMLFLAVYFLYFHGFIREYFIPAHPALDSYIWIVTVSMMSVLYFGFMRVFLHTKDIISRIDPFVRVYMGIRIALIPIELIYYYFSSNYPLMNTLSLVCGGIDALLSAVLFVVLYKTGSITARYFILGALSLNIAVIAGIFIYSYSRFAYSLVYQSGAALEVLLFSLGLGYKIKENELEKRRAQADLIEQLHQNDKLQKKHTQELEDKVTERTAKVLQQKEEIAAQSEHMKAALSQLGDKNRQLQRTNKHITDSINYARRIQRAILCDQEEITRNFKDAFVLLAPKDIVSGDFYWFNEDIFAHKNEPLGVQITAPPVYDEEDDNSKRLHPRVKVLIAADGTGHGVPGAFMTVMGQNLLDEIILNQKITEPSQILYELDHRLTSTLQKTRTENSAPINDGMDVSILAVDEKAGKVYFSGAKHPFWYVRDGAIHQVKGSKFPIGSSQYRVSKVFETFTMDIQQGDVYYIFSDGFQDQFGGALGRKYMRKYFRKFLLEISGRPLKIQKQLLETELRDWQDTNPQTDDVLIIGVKM
ncbi:7TM diverse intracellular signaling domain-containing protein [uncultured Microscilla sp.]|uniref:7TM diverse intracellular signaling domain-containing protein n=1 Tax=uncultured Microscilla sp. TaxID=432653 RepID=UPI002630AEB9|nr:7TM diverse intracellular signaling domain-containing protein [uncultured Microscilla sp.]